MADTLLEGRVLKNYKGFYYVQGSDLVVYECKVRGKVKDRILSGDRVMFTPLGLGLGVLESLLPRENQLYRPKVANLDLVLIVMAYSQPQPSLVLLDRLLFLVNYNGLTPIIVLNKCDLPADKEVEDILAYYPSICRVFTTSAQNNIGTYELKDSIKGQVAVLAGPSGAGKSSLLNRLKGQKYALTQEVSSKIGRGKHTTRHVELYPLENGGFIVDTPGFGVLDLPFIRKEELERYFPDFQSYNTACQFSNCLHYKEKECGVKKAVQEHKIISTRYNHYLSMLQELMENERW